MKFAAPPLFVRQRPQLRNHTLLAPATWQVRQHFRKLAVDPLAHARLISAVQRFRGQSYLADRALRPSQLTADGRHAQPVDHKSWHLVVHNDLGEIVSCARYHPIAEPHFEATVASQSALAGSPEWRVKVKAAVESMMKRAALRGAGFAELGGWCVGLDVRNTTHAFRSILCMYALGEILGGDLGVSTATTRHSSSSILQRMGAQKASLNGEVLPSYFEPMFGCQMELLQFDSLRPAKRYAPQVAGYSAGMKAEVRVVCCAPPTLQLAPSSLIARLASGPAPQLDAGLLVQ